MAPRTYYELLGVKLDAAPQQIRAAYRRVAKAYHPDQNESDSDPEMFRKVTEAYDVLTDALKRADYDRQFLHPQQPPPPKVTHPPRATHVAKGSHFNDPGPQFRSAPICTQKSEFSDWLRGRSWPLLGLVTVSYELLRWSEGMSSSAGVKGYVVTSLSQLFVYVTFALVLAFLFVPKKRVRFPWSRMMRILGRFYKRKSAQSHTTESEDQNLAPK